MEESQFPMPADPNRYSEELIERERALSDGSARPRPQPTVKTLERLEQDVDFWMYASPVVRGWLRDFYVANPARATKLVEHVVTATQNGSLKMPDVYLGKRLKEELGIEKGEQA